MKDYDDVQDDVDEYVGALTADVPKVRPDDRCRGKKTEGPPGEKTFVGYCGAWAGRGTDHVGEGRCKHHGGNNSGGNGQGAPDENENAVTHGAFREHFTRHLTDGEEKAFEEARDLLGDPSGAKEVARTAASICLIQYDRTGDERFMRRYESICDKAGIFPNEEIDVNHSGSIDLWMDSAQEEDE